jgi:single-stranded DNA-binding protein
MDARGECVAVATMTAERGGTMSLNVCALVGTLSRDPRTAFEGDGRQTTTFTLAIVEPGREGKAFTLYVPCVCWGKAAEAADVLNAEDLVSVQGKLCWRKHVDKHGQDRSTLAVNVREVSVLQPAALPA